MKRYIDEIVRRDLNKKMVFLTGPRQVGKTTLARQILQSTSNGQYFNYDTAIDRKTITAQSWNPDANTLVFDELHKMPNWKNWLKGVYDGKPEGQQILVTGSARLDYLKKSGDSLAGRFFALRLHPVSIKEWCDSSGANAPDALTHLLERGGFPESTLAANTSESERWRMQYLDDLIREDILEFSRLHEVNTMRVLVQLLRERVGSPLSVASLARDLNASTTTIFRYIQILEALHVVFTITPWHRNVARSLLKAPKIYFYDTGLVRGDEGVRFENLVATHLLKWSHYQRDVMGSDVNLHYLRTRDEAEVDFALIKDSAITHLIEGKLSDTKVHPALARFSAENPNAKSLQLLRHCRQSNHHQTLTIVPACEFLHELV